MAGQSNTCLKVFLIVVNFIFLTLGVAILAVGIYLCTSASMGKVSEVFAGLDTLRNVRFILIGSGCFIMLVSICGFFGACREKRILIILYLVFLIGILIANVAAIALAIVYHGKVKGYFVKEAKYHLKTYYGNTTTDFSATFTKGVDAIQNDEKCCGWTGRDGENFFLSTPWFLQQKPDSRHNYPDSCCPVTVLSDTTKKEKCVRATDDKIARDDGYLHEDDCSDKLVTQNSLFMRAVLASVILAVLMQIICIVCSIVILRQISGDGGGRMV